MSKPTDALAQAKEANERAADKLLSMFEATQAKGWQEFIETRDALILAAKAHKSEHKACPCLHTTPCHPRCTCVMPHSSRGCRRCCSYGSPEQQKAMAEHLVAQAHGRAQEQDEENDQGAGLNSHAKVLSQLLDETSLLYSQECCAIDKDRCDALEAAISALGRSIWD